MLFNKKNAIIVNFLVSTITASYYQQNICETLETLHPQIKTTQDSISIICLVKWRQVMHLLHFEMN